MDPTPNRKPRRAAPTATAEGLDTAAFLRLADRFIRLANTENRKTHAADLHMTLLFAAARYSAHVAKNVLDVPDQEAFVAQMQGTYAEMLRNNLADPEV